MSDRLFVSTRKGLFTIQRTGTDTPHWAVTRASFLGDNVTLVYPDSRNGRVYAVLDHGHFGIKMHSSTDCGVSWKECAVPVYPTPPSDHKPDICAMSGIEIPWSLKLIWALAAGGPDEPDVLWCGTVPGGLFRSDDGGDSWQFIRSLWDQPDRKHWFGGGLDYPGIHSICVDPRNANHITVGVSCGGVWQTRDRGE
ncbi:MAG: exo-alpha-sialidase, partial [Candidatus Hydrogenedentes bacterium]|nr:exo-alpha-sialidase [Candidatus Hydrogenedentota bacterium]